MPTESPSSGTDGFFQQSPHIRNAFVDDESLKRVYRFYLPSDVQTEIFSDLHQFGDVVLNPKVLAWCADAERNTPTLRTWDSWGRRIDELNTSEGWRCLQDLGIAEGIVALGYDEHYAQFGRIYQFLKYHVWTPSSAFVTCPSAMTDGAARLLHLQLRNAALDEVQRKVFDDAFRSLISRNPKTAKTSGQWMTERSGGSDIRETETRASLVPSSRAPLILAADGNPLGPYSISGFKWFSSATDAAMAVLLAKEPSGTISAFFAPMRRRSSQGTAHNANGTVLNGIAIQRLKNKLGTRAVPTAELVLSDLRAWPLGKPGDGTREISTILNITRVHNAVTAVGLWGRGLCVSRAFSRVRRARGRLLMDMPAHVRTLAEQHVQYHAMMHLTFFTSALLGVCENSSTLVTASTYPAAKLLDSKTASHLLRLMTPLSKILTAKAAITGLAECMESLGGVGYLENEDVVMNIGRLFRDANVISIWEGTTNVLADDLVRVLKGSAGAKVIDCFDSLVINASQRWQSAGKAEWTRALSPRWRELRLMITTRSKEELAVDGRFLASELGWIICAILLAEDALSDNDEVCVDICTRWVVGSNHHPGMHGLAWTEKARLDRKLVFGDGTDVNARL